MQFFFFTLKKPEDPSVLGRSKVCGPGLYNIWRQREGALAPFASLPVLSSRAGKLVKKSGRH